MAAFDFTGPVWKRNRDDWNESVQELRIAALGSIEARRAWVPSELGAAWDALGPLLDEIDFRGIPREADIWRKAVRAIRTMRDAVTADEPSVATALDELMASAVLFADQAIKDQAPLLP
jgi:hypothetical protein